MNEEKLDRSGSQPGNEWVNARKKLPEDSGQYEDPDEFLVRVAGDDPRSGWIFTKYATAKEVEEIAKTEDGSVEWLNEKLPPPSQPVREGWDEIENANRYIPSKNIKGKPLVKIGKIYKYPGDRYYWVAPGWDIQSHEVYEGMEAVGRFAYKEDAEKWILENKLPPQPSQPGREVNIETLYHYGEWLGQSRSTIDNWLNNIEPQPPLTEGKEEKIFTQSEFDTKFKEYQSMYESADPRYDQWLIGQQDVWIKFIENWQPGQSNSGLGQALENKFTALKSKEPSEGWSDRDMENAYDNGYNAGFSNGTRKYGDGWEIKSGEQWLSSYKK